MSITAKWYNTEKSIIHHLYEGRWTWDEFYEVISNTETMLKETPHNVMLIAEMSPNSTMPVGVPGQFRRVRQFLENPQIAGSVIVGMNRLVQIFFDIFVQFSPQFKQRIHVARTLEEAENLILEQQKSEDQST